ncbi:epididymal secretory protein 4-like [Anolis carolinensis]|uniref:epididymal secretory protein 4-like n=1 Tax=Anolis carolinensis TaxID=28377 RepID=UPI002F2B7ECC
MEARKETSILLLVASLVAFSHAFFEIPVFGDVDLTKLAGKWYPVMTVKRDPSEKPTYAHTMEPLEDGDVLVKVEIPQKGGCVLKKVSLSTVGPGVFSALGGQVVLMDTDYTTYHFVYSTTGDALELHLYGTPPFVCTTPPKRIGEVGRVSQ